MKYTPNQIYELNKNQECSQNILELIQTNFINPKQFEQIS